MGTTSRVLRAGAFGCVLLASTALTAPALAQSAPPPRFNQVDTNGVDLVTGDFFFSMTEGTIGSGEGALALMRNWAGPAGWTDNWSGALYTRTMSGTAQIVVEFGSYSDTFSISGGTYTSTKADGATLADLGGVFRYTASDGTQIDFASASELGYPIKGPACQRANDGTCAIPTAIRRPNGMIHALNWDVEERCFQLDEELQCISSGAYPRFRGVSNSANYSFTIGYLTNTPGSGVPASNWFVRTGAQFTNLDTAPGSLPTVSYSSPASTVTEVTDTGGQVWRLTNGSAGRLTGIRRPGAGSDTITITYTSGATTAASVTREGVATSYAWSDEEENHLATVTDAASDVTEVRSDFYIRRITSVTDPLERTTLFAYDENGRLTRQTQPEGNSTGYSYDARGNVTEVRTREKDDSDDTGDDLVSSASYDSSCSNVVTCNQPNSVTDARGNVTDFTYDSTHGGVLTVTAPAPGGSGDRPQTRYSYSQVTAVTGEPVYLLTGVSACASGTAGGSPSCVGTTSEARTVTAYDTDNLRVTSTTARNGTNSISMASALTYDAIGNLLTVDGPVSGTADTTRYRYDSARRVVGTAGPDPDGGGSLTHRAERRTFTNGLLTKVESGNVASQSDGDWAGFTALQEVQLEYDGNARPVVQRVVSGSTAYALTQTSYDALGRTQCVAQRMNNTQFATGSLPSDACTLDTEGGAGPDRIARTYYEAAGQVAQLRTAYAVSGHEANEASATFTSNGRLATLTDAEGNRTTYEYDVFDRLLNLRYPSPTTDGVSAPTSGTGNDFEQYGYDAAGNVTSRRLRDGNSIATAYDNLNRMSSRDMPGSEPTVSYTYDLMGRLLTAATSAQTLTFTYDALGRNLTQTGPLGTITSGYDGAGRRGTLALPGSTALTVGYSYDASGALTQLRENPAGSNSLLATMDYDAAGRPAILTRGAGMTITTYDYYPTGWRQQIGHNLAGGATNDLVLQFSYNPAGQISQALRDNDSYAWTGHYAVNRAYTTNGLNQHTAAGAASFSYDARGNLTGDGTHSYGYDSENRMVSGNGATLVYDPLGRLYQVTASGGAVTRFLYDGAALVAEYNGSNTLLRRYVHGAGADVPLVWYEGSGLSDRRYFHADERGSVVAVADSGGNALSANSYDEYGIPAAGNSGRFQYTGQTWLSEIGMYYYRARIYSPTLGRFMQTDPIGFEGGMNLYAYVRNDPTNLTDPSGMDPPIVVTGHRGGFDNSCDDGLLFDADGRACASFWQRVSMEEFEEWEPGRGEREDARPCIGEPYAGFIGKTWMPASNIAIQRHADPIMIMGVWALESDWGRSYSSRNRNNIFGMTPRGDATPGLRFGSVIEGAARWNELFGPRILDTDRSVGLFLGGLQQDNRENPEGVDRRGSYNSQTPEWASRVKDTIESVRSRMATYATRGC